MSSGLTVLCITRAEPHSEPFLLAMLELAAACSAELHIAADGLEAFEAVLAMPRLGDAADLVMVHSRGYLESVLDYALEGIRSEWVLRLDDDERVNAEMAAWLEGGFYTGRPAWSFRRLNLWRDAEHALGTELLWPDPQLRLTRRELAGGRRMIHQASPHGLGHCAPPPVVLEHHKFLVKSLEARRAIATQYEALQPGAGSGVFLPFSVPEDFYSAKVLEGKTVTVESLRNGAG